MPVVEYRPTREALTNPSLPGSPALFLYGPEQGAPAWQGEAVKLLENFVGEENELHVINPAVSDVPANERLDGVGLRVWHIDRRSHVASLGGNGVFAFWLPAPLNPETLGSQGETAYLASTNHAWERVVAARDLGTLAASRLAVGISNDWSPAALPYRRGAAEIGYDIDNSLEALCHRAARLALALPPIPIL